MRYGSLLVGGLGASLADGLLDAIDGIRRELLCQAQWRPPPTDARQSFSGDR